MTDRVFWNLYDEIRFWRIVLGFRSFSHRFQVVSHEVLGQLKEIDKIECCHQSF